MEPIDLRMASVREARNADRRFCFEVITPQYTRVYQATNEEDMKSWISAVNNALQTAVEAAGKPDRPSTDSLPGQTHRDIASVLTGKSPSMSSHRNTYGSKAPARHATVGDRPGGYRREETFGDEGKLLKQVRDADAGNKMCADCGTEIKVDWYPSVTRHAHHKGPLFNVGRYVLYSRYHRDTAQGRQPHQQCYLGSKARPRAEARANVDKRAKAALHHVKVC